MCGIAGLLWTPSAGADQIAAVHRMTSSLAHRGPDDAGVWSDETAGVALGFRRLAILDVSPMGAQPMRSADQRYVMVFNGEVYNYRELRAELQAMGARFRGGSDSEVILAAVLHWGLEAAVRRFIGMFAIALWDTRQRTLHLVRDRLGIKPLHIYRRSGVVGFASELKALLHVPGFERSIDHEALSGYLRYLYVPAPRTIFENVTKLEPGRILTIADARSPLPPAESYWSVPGAVAAGRADMFTGGDEEATDAAESLLLDAARLRLRSDVPLGAFLSGGIDSSTVVALMQAASDRPVRTFSVGFDSPEHDETAHAGAIARVLGTDHTELRLNGADVRDLIPRMSTVFDEPFADASQLPTLLICQAARDAGLVVAVSGDGGDEVFAGYNRYTYGERVLTPALRIPRTARHAMSAGLHAISPRTLDRLHGLMVAGLPAGMRQRLIGDKIHKLGSLLPHADFAGMYRSTLSAWQNPEDLVSGSAGHGLLEEVLAEAGDLDALSVMMMADQMTYLPDDLLAKVDRASMAASLEVRVPLLDHRVVEFGWRLPRHLKVRNGKGKWLLRSVLQKYVPAALFERPKVGFSVPIDQWLRGPLSEWAEDLLSEDRLRRDGVLRAEPVRRAWTEFLAGRGRGAHALWAVLMFQMWHEEWIA